MKEKVNQFSDLKNTRRRRRFFIRMYLLVFVGAVVLFTIGWFFISFPFFKFKVITSNASETSIGDKIIEVVKSHVEKNSVAKKFLGVNHFFIWPSSLVGKDIGLPELDKIEIKKNYFGQALLINILEKDIAGIWCLRKNVAEATNDPSNCWVFDRLGRVFRKSLSTSGNLIKVIDDFTQDSLDVDSKILPEPLTENMLSILDVISKSSISPKKIEIKNLNLQELEVQTFDGPVIYFSLRRNATAYLDVLNTLAKEPGFSKLAYVDLRVENRVYTHK